MNDALEAGYRHIDTAPAYENEHVIGKVLKSWIDSGKVKREELFIVTKVVISKITYVISQLTLSSNESLFLAFSLWKQA